MTAKRTPFSRGRPLGYLMAWLQEHYLHATANEHNENAVCVYVDRRSGRDMLKAIPGSAALLSNEAPLDDGEASEPED